MELRVPVQGQEQMDVIRHKAGNQNLRMPVERAFPVVRRLTSRGEGAVALHHHGYGNASGTAVGTGEAHRPPIPQVLCAPS